MEPHATRIVVWDTPTAIECGAALRFKIGVKCAAECRCADWRVAIRDAEGRSVASVTVGDMPWPGTAALYVAEVGVRAPEAEGLHVWEAVLEPGVSATDHAAHAGATATLHVRTVRVPECVVTVVAVDAVSRAPVRGARVVVHPYRATTNAEGVAEIRVPKGAYRLFVSGRDYVPFRSDGEISADVTIEAELEIDRGPSDAELWS